MRAHVLVTLFYVLSRALLDRAGLPFSFALDWMWLADPADLRDRLYTTLLHFHAFPPGANALTGLLLKAAGTQAGLAAHALFFAFGVIVVNALVALGRALALPAWGAAVVTILFMLMPATIYFEHLYHYEWPVTMLLLTGAVLWHQGVARPGLAVWSACFGVCALIVITRSTFHFVWFAAVVILAAFFSGRRAWRSIGLAALAPAAFILCVYGKNLWLFGEFAASTFGPASLTLVTTAQLPAATRAAWIADGVLSPLAEVSVYAPPRAYARFFTSADRPGWPPAVTRLDHVSVNAPNFNHWWLLEVHRRRRGDVIEYLRRRPGDYARHVVAGVGQLFRPSTRWHPRDGTDASPHAGHRGLLGQYETAFARVMHGPPLAPFGVYVMLPPILAWALARGWRLRRAPPRGCARAEGALLWLCAFQIGWVVAASTMLTALEWPRYRYQVEWAIWLLAAAAASALVREVAARADFSRRAALVSREARERM